MAKKKKSWQEKLHDSKDLPRIEPITERMSRRWGTGTVVIPAPLEVDALMRQVPSGKLTTIDEIRKTLAKKHNATIGCPLTTGIFAWVAAHVAYEQSFGGEKGITPYWRTLKSDGALNPKYPGGVQEQAARLKAEGHIIEIFKGNRLPKVKDFEKSLTELQ
jgi:hypothetical protein